MCDNLVLDKIDNRVYNVHRNHQGGLYTYTRPIFTFPLGVFQGILSEYLALKYGPQVVYMDFRDFLVTGYVCTSTGGWTPAYPLVFSWWFVRFTFFIVMSQWFPFGFPFGFSLCLPKYIWLGIENFCLK